MDSIKTPIIVAACLFVFACGMLLFAQGGQSLASTGSKDGNSEMNMGGWKGLLSKWGGAALLISAGAVGSYGAFPKFANWVNTLVGFIFQGW